MSWLHFVSYVAMRGLLSKNRIFELPVIMSIFALAWLIPQGVTAERQVPGVSTVDELFWLYVLLCFRRTNGILSSRML